MVKTSLPKKRNSDMLLQDASNDLDHFSLKNHKIFGLDPVHPFETHAPKFNFNRPQDVHLLEPYLRKIDHDGQKRFKALGQEAYSLVIPPEKDSLLLNDAVWSKIFSKNIL